MIAAKSLRAIPIPGLLLASQKIAREETAAETHDGRKLVEEVQSDLADTRPGTDVGVYQRIMMLEPEVALRLSEAAQIRGAL